MDFDPSQLPPEQLQALLEMGALNDQDAQLQAQLEQAQALAQGSGRQYTTAAGAALGGLGDALRAGLGGMREKDLRSKQQGVSDKRTKARKTFADLLLGINQPGAMPAVQPLAPSASSAAPLGPVYGAPYGAGPYGYVPGGG